MNPSYFKDKLSPFWWGIICCVILASLFNIQFLLNLNIPLSLAHGDSFLVSFTLKHYMNIFFSGNWEQLLTMPMFYGFKNSLFFSDHHLIQALEALPIYIITRDIVITSNLLSYLTILASSISMYILAFYLTKDGPLSILASIIFVFNPYVSAHFPEHLILFSLQWIPLIFLFFEKSLEKPTNKNLFLVFFLLTCQLLSSLYYSAFLTVILPIYAIVRFWQTKALTWKLLNRGAVIGALMFLSVAAGSAFFYRLVYPQEFSNRSTLLAGILSAQPADLVTSSYGKNFSHNIFAVKTGLVDGQEIPSIDVIGLERAIFWGFVVWCLFLLGFLRFWHSPNRSKVVLYLGLLIFCVFLSFGAKILITDKISLPGPYKLLQFVNPLFDYIRAPVRFAAFTFFFLSLFIILTWKELLNNVKYKSLVVIFILVLVIIEYWNEPLKFYEISAEQKYFYNILNQQYHINVIVDLPMGNQESYTPEGITFQNTDYTYLLYASVLHSKILLNGYSGFTPSQYFDRKTMLSYGFPTLNKIKLLKSWGVDGIILHKKDFIQAENFNFIKDQLITMGLPLVVSTPELALFDITSMR